MGIISITGARETVKQVTFSIWPAANPTTIALPFHAMHFRESRQIMSISSGTER